MASEYITKEGLLRIKQKMKELAEERPQVIKRVVEAREQGDLSENAEYHAARERQKHLENEYNHLTKRVSILQVLDTDTIPKDAIRFGALITIKNLDTQKISEHKIVGIDETFDYADGIQRVSTASPLGKASLGKKTNEKFIVKAPIGDKKFQVISIK